MLNFLILVEVLVKWETLKLYPCVCVCVFVLFCFLSFPPLLYTLSTRFVCAGVLLSIWTTLVNLLGNRASHVCFPPAQDTE